MHLLLANNSAAGIAKGVPAFESLASANGTGSSSTITFNNINTYHADYDELVFRIIWNYSTNQNATVGVYMSFNGDTNGSNYLNHTLRGSGVNAAASSTDGNTGTGIVGIPLNASVSGMQWLGGAIINVSGYNTTSKRTVIRSLHGAHIGANTDSQVALTSGLWNSTNNVTSIQFGLTSGRTFTTNTSIALYGIKKVTL
jgi:hypothetical protein